MTKFKRNTYSFLQLGVIQGKAATHLGKKRLKILGKVLEYVAKFRKQQKTLN